MFEKIVSVGERGQVTIPKEMRDKGGIKPKDKLVFRVENKKIILEKKIGKKEMEKLLAKGYKKLAKISSEVEDEWRYASKEADEMLDEY
jgi:AbrB family looped-hinge helix DNA binding protein